MPASAMPTDWMKGPIPRPNDPCPVFIPKGVYSDTRIDAHIKAANTCQSGTTIALGVAKAGADALVGLGITAGEQLLNTTGVGAMVNLVRHGKSAASTFDHIENLAELLNRINTERCTCGQCENVIIYVLGKKSNKFGKRVAKCIPGIGLLATIGEKAKGIYKLAKGTRGVNRTKFAAVVWIAAKEGCPTAKSVICELMGGPAKMYKAVSSYTGILDVAVKMRSV